MEDKVEAFMRSDFTKNLGKFLADALKNTIFKNFDIKILEDGHFVITRKHYHIRPDDFILIKEFKKDFKNLKKRFPSLDNDFENFKKNQLIPFYERKINYFGIVCISKRGFQYPVYKAKKFVCKSLGSSSNSGIRIIYACLNHKIVFIEIYFKGDKKNENMQRIKKILNCLSKQAWQDCF